MRRKLLMAPVAAAAVAASIVAGSSAEPTPKRARRPYAPRKGRR